MNFNVDICDPRPDQVRPDRPEKVVLKKLGVDPAIMA